MFLAQLTLSHQMAPLSSAPVKLRKTRLFFKWWVTILLSHIFIKICVILILLVMIGINNYDTQNIFKKKLLLVSLYQPILNNLFLFLALTDTPIYPISYIFCVCVCVCVCLCVCVYLPTLLTQLSHHLTI